MSLTSGNPHEPGHPPPPTTPPGGYPRWRQVLRGEEHHLAKLRAWIRSLLPDCPARDDLLVIANELATNALCHTRSGQGGWLAAEITVYPGFVRIGVADQGSRDKTPILIDNPTAETGRGLLTVDRLAANTGMSGDATGRLLWADIPWQPTHTPPAQATPSPQQAAPRQNQATPACTYAGITAWYRRMALAWHTLPAPPPRGLVPI